MKNNTKKILILFFIAAAAILIPAGLTVAFFHAQNREEVCGIFEYTEDEGTRYIKTNGEYGQNEWININRHLYYFDEYCRMVTGIKKIDGIDYRFAENGILESGWMESEGHKYYVNSDASLTYGWYELGGETYYFDKNGYMVSGTTEIDGIKYAFSNEGQLLHGWQIDNLYGSKYYVNPDGTFSTGFITIDKKLYYLDENSRPVTGWKNLSGEKYYFDKNGVCSTNLSVIDGTYYTFNDKGKLITKDFLLDVINNVPDNYDKNAIYGVNGYTPDTQDIEKLTKTIEDMNSRYTIGFIMINLYNGKGIARNIDSTVYSASCIKGPYIASLIADNPSLLERNGRTFQVIVEESDNKLYSSVRSSYGRNSFLKWCEQSTADTDTATYNYPQLSVRNLAKLWVQNYYFFNTDATGMAIRDWYISPNASAIYTTLASNKVRTESKAGWISEGNYHSTTDGGIIYPEQGAPYLICICTNIPSNMDALNQLCLDLRDIYQKTCETD